MCIIIFPGWEQEEVNRLAKEIETGETDCYPESPRCKTCRLECHYEGKFMVVCQPKPKIL